MKIKLQYEGADGITHSIVGNTDLDPATNMNQDQLRAAMEIIMLLKSRLEHHLIRVPKTVPELLEEGAATYRERNKLYGDNYKHFGQAILSAFGGSIPAITTAEDANRLGVVVQCIGKMTRYCQSFEDGGHLDSAHDASVYCAMLEELTQ